MREKKAIIVSFEYPRASRNEVESKILPELRKIDYICGCELFYNNSGGFFMAKVYTSVEPDESMFQAIYKSLANYKVSIRIENVSFQVSR